MTRSQQGYLVPELRQSASSADLQLILEVCPSIKLAAMEDPHNDEHSHSDPVWGVWRRIAHYHAADPSECYQGASGGVLTALAVYLLKSGQVDFILHARASGKDPLLGESCLSFNRDQVLEAAGSRYAPTAVLINIREVLERSQPFVVIGKPCDISALRNYARHDPRVNQLVRYWLTFVCGGFMPPEGTAKFLRDRAIDPDNVSRLRYRGHGFPGPVHVETLDDQQFDFSYVEFWGEDYKRWTLPHRCKICPDSIGEAADLVAADPWPGGGPDPEHLEAPGNNVILCRSKAGENLLQQATASAALAVGSEGSIEMLNDYQPHQVARKFTAWPRFQGLEAEGRLVPESSGLRIRELAETMDAAFLRQQREGMRQRVREGKAWDALPADSS